MPTQSATADLSPNQLLPVGTKLGELHLAVTDADNALRFWSGILGLKVLGEENGTYRLGAANTAIVLHPGASGPVAPRRTGLYHVALHIPTRRELARIIARLFALRYPNSPTDHLVSETTYLSDPDGNGIELTLETPERGEFVRLPGGRFGARTTEGELRSGRDPVDLETLFKELAPDEDMNAPLHILGVHHVHLHVADLEASRHFYRDLIGFRPQMDLTEMQMLDFGLDGSNPVHALALNTWSGAGAPPAPTGTAGLRRFTLELPSGAGVQAVVARLQDANWSYDETPEGVSVLDPSGNRLDLRVAAA